MDNKTFISKSIKYLKLLEEEDICFVKDELEMSERDKSRLKITKKIISLDSRFEEYNDNFVMIDSFMNGNNFTFYTNLETDLYLCTVYTYINDYESPTYIVTLSKDEESDQKYSVHIYHIKYGHYGITLVEESPEYYG